MGRRVVFMGSASFAVPSLRVLATGGWDLALVLTRPDKPSGRGLELSETPVKVAARDLGLPVFQPKGLRDAAVQQAVRDAAPDVIVVAAYGRILPPEVLATPPRLPAGGYGCINVHGSILPRWRGAAPVQRAVVAGDHETGVTLMSMDEGLDTGPILAATTTPIRPEDTAATLFARLAADGADLLGRTLAAALAGEVVPSRQDETLATLAPILRKEEGAVAWAATSARVADLVRGMEPWPGAFTFSPRGLRLRVFPFVRPCPGRGEPGRVLSVDSEGLVVATGDGAVLVPEVQPAGSRRMTAREAVAGRRVVVGDILA